MNYRIFPPEELIEATLQMPLSKSISNRALIIAALTHGAELPAEVAECNDTEILLQALHDDSADTIDVAAAGTAMRFLTAYFAATPGRTVTITGSERMLQRPIGPLVDALSQIGASIEYIGEQGFPPLRITGKRLKGGSVDLNASVSSQFISALLMVAPVMDSGLRIILHGDIVSRPYIDMTLAMMDHAGITTDFTENTITVEPGEYQIVSHPIEADWSAASYWFEIAALSSGFIDLKGLALPALQGDSRIASLMEVTGLRTESDDDNTLQLLPTPDPGARLYTDMSETPDLVQTMAVTCCLLQIPFRFTGVRSLRIKETDRLEALSRELLRLGYLLVTEGDNELRWDGVRFPVSDEPPAFDTYSDHRMAMALAPVSLFVPGIVINNAEVVAKSYPGFWDDMRSAGFIIEDAES
ncbi:MAG: 3-phosphoshikimate 1-carboxyvinyltransferase [Muribaculaceae bacterium]|nr:3-phosphoshikimate 1-carboxyvinyltransferase [Muribaculaceae bacterium]